MLLSGKNVNQCSFEKTPFCANVFTLIVALYLCRNQETSTGTLEPYLHYDRRNVAPVLVPGPQFVPAPEVECVEGPAAIRVEFNY